MFFSSYLFVIIISVAIFTTYKYVLFANIFYSQGAKQFEVIEVQCAKAVDGMQSSHSDTSFVEEVAIFSIIYFDFGTVFLTSEIIKISNYPHYSIFCQILSSVGVYCKSIVDCLNIRIVLKLCQMENKIRHWWQSNDNPFPCKLYFYYEIKTRISFYVLTYLDEIYFLWTKEWRIQDFVIVIVWLKQTPV